MAPLGSPSPLGFMTQPDNGGESLLIGTPMLSSSFRPSIVVIIGVLTTMFSLTFFLLLYVKRCKFILVGEGGEIPEEPGATPPFPRTYSSIDRLLIEAFPMLSFASLPLSNSGVDRLLVEALPMFTFASLQGIKEGLECAVCLCQFEDNDILRLLPKCQHAFHVDCVDLWLASHSTCPLCRHCVAKKLSPHTPRDATTMASMGATMGLEPSCQSTSRLPGITDRPPLPPSVKPKYDFEGKGAPFVKRAFSLGRMSSLDLDERLHMGSGQTSLSVVGTTVEQI
ncbi:unnamed protein product, partial [Sphagnum compactum]